MTNQQLSDYIKYELSKGIDRESVIKDLIQSGLDDNSIQEVFNAIDTPIKATQATTSKPEDNPTIQIKPKGNKFKKIFKIILGILIVIEIYNLGGYVYYKYFKDGVICDLPMPSCYVHNYRPWVVQVIYGLIPSLDSNSCVGCDYKPVIYLYPAQTQDVKVMLDYNGKLIADYPAYDYSIKGWEVTAFSDGKIINKDGKEYSYLFWEGKPEKPINYDLSTGFVIKGEDTISFLQDILPRIGLTPKEYNEFIVYWYPVMKENKYNLIHFADKEYTDNAPLSISPSPDSMLRVFMVVKPLDEIVDVAPQEIKTFNRTGFSVVEWGGTILSK